MLLLVDALAGAVPILLIAWLFRVVSRKGLTTRSAIASTLTAGFVGFLIRSFGEGEGGWESRLANIPAMSEFAPVFLSTMIALVLTYLVALGRAQGKAEERE